MKTIRRDLFATSLLTLLSVIATTSATTADVIPGGEEFQVNTYTTDGQELPAVGTNADGAFVAVWQSPDSDDSDSDLNSIQGRRYASDGTPLGDQFQVNTYTTGNQRLPNVALDADGNFVVVWQSDGSSGNDNSSRSVQGQRYASDGTPRGGEFQVNAYTSGSQAFADLFVAADGNFVVAWESSGSPENDNSSASVQAQRFASNGSANGSAFQVNTYTTSFQVFPAIAADSNADFVIVWQSNGSTGSDLDSSIQGQRYTSDGTPRGGEFQVNSYVDGFQSYPDVSVASLDGGFVVAWQSAGSNGTDTDGTSILGQRYASNGTVRGGEFQVNTYTTGFQTYYLAVAMGDTGEFLVAWESLGSLGTDIDSKSVLGQHYTSDGERGGDEIQLNTYTTSFQNRPGLAAGSDGVFVAVWQSNGSNGSDDQEMSIQGRRFFSPLFTDGFESGDTIRWSSVVP